MTATVVPDPASPCWGGPDPFDPSRPVRWPEREWRAQITCVDNGDGTVTATAVPYPDGLHVHSDPQTVTKTISIEEHTTTRVPTGNPAGPRHGVAMRSVVPPGGGLRWVVEGDPHGRRAFSQRDKAQLRADAINRGDL